MCQFLAAVLVSRWGLLEQFATHSSGFCTWYGAKKKPRNLLVYKALSRLPDLDSDQKPSG